MLSRCVGSWWACVEMVQDFQPWRPVDEHVGASGLAELEQPHAELTVSSQHLSYTFVIMWSGHTYMYSVHASHKAWYDTDTWLFLVTSYYCIALCMLNLILRSHSYQSFNVKGIATGVVCYQILLLFKVFFLKAQCNGRSAEVNLDGKELEDYVWVTKEEMKDYVSQEYYAAVAPILMNWLLIITWLFIFVPRLIDEGAGWLFYFFFFST